MHQLVPIDILARIISSKLTDNVNANEYSFQEECGKSDTATFYKLRQFDIHKTIIVGVYTLTTTNAADEKLLKCKYEQNVKFLEHAAEHKIHSLCPTIVANDEKNSEFPFHWIAYEHVDGWKLDSKWSQLKPDTRLAVIRNLATFVRELATVSSFKPPKDETTVGYVGSTTMGHVLFPPVLVDNSAFWLGEDLLATVKGYGDLVGAVANAKTSVAQFRFWGGSTKSLAAEQVEAIVHVAKAILDQPCDKVLTHLNLAPENIWIDPFTGKLVAVFGWELACYAPTWMATAPLPWLMDERVDLVLATEVKNDPWKVWRPNFLHPPKSTGKELRSLRTVWEGALRSAEENHPFSKAILAEDLVKRRALRVCFVEKGKLGESVEWAYEIISSANLHPDSNIALGLLTPIKNVIARQPNPSILPSSSQVVKEGGSHLVAVTCSPANSIIPDAIYFPGLLSRDPSTMGGLSK